MGGRDPTYPAPRSIPDADPIGGFSHHALQPLDEAVHVPEPAPQAPDKSGRAEVKQTAFTH